MGILYKYPLPQRKSCLPIAAFLSSRILQVSLTVSTKPHRRPGAWDSGKCRDGKPADFGATFFGDQAKAADSPISVDRNHLSEWDGSKKRASRRVLKHVYIVTYVVLLVNL